MVQLLKFLLSVHEASNPTLVKVCGMFNGGQVGSLLKEASALKFISRRQVKVAQHWQFATTTAVYKVVDKTGLEEYVEGLENPRVPAEY